MSHPTARIYKICRGGPRAALMTGLFLCLSVPALSSDRAAFTLSDVRVLYVTNPANAPDWPTLYYLNDEFGCRVDVLLIRPGERFRCVQRSVPGQQLYWHECSLPEGNEAHLDSLTGRVLSDRYPDIILLDGPGDDDLFDATRQHVMSLPVDPERLFGVIKVYERDRAETDDQIFPRLALNGAEMCARYRERMEREIPRLMPGVEIETVPCEQLVVYRLTQSAVESQSHGSDFLSGIDYMRLPSILEANLADGPKKQALTDMAASLAASLDASRQAAGRQRVDLVAEAYRQAHRLSAFEDYGEELESKMDFRPYLQNLAHQAERSALEAIGLHWFGKVLRRDSPHGPRLKFQLSLSVNGPREIDIAAARFCPYWDSTAIVLDSMPKTILPHQTFVREYLVDIERSRLETPRPETLLFTVSVMTGQMPLELSASLPTWLSPRLEVSFEPDFYFVPPLPKLDADRVVASMTLGAIVSKPVSYTGTVQLSLETPRGLFAGAYRQQIALKSGSTSETIRIPFSISNLFELGVQHLYLTLGDGTQVVAADTARVRIAACDISGNIKVGLLPDTTGLLEDILRMTKVGFEAITDRSLLTADLGAYDVIIVGSGSFRWLGSFRAAKNRFEGYVSNGGSLVVLGQPDDWPDGSLPVSLVPGAEFIGRADISNRIPEARILNRPYAISDDNLLVSFGRPREVRSAVISPAEKVYVSSSGGTLLSVSRLGQGQIIYCGLPVLDMISQLEIDAIHLFANIVNY